jgi:hypothetical protein
MKLNRETTPTTNGPKLPAGTWESEATLIRVSVFGDQYEGKPTVSLSFEFRIDKEKDGEVQAYYARSYGGFSVSQRDGTPIITNRGKAKLLGLLSGLAGRPLKVNDKGYLHDKEDIEMVFPKRDGLNPEEMHEAAELLNYFTAMPTFDFYMELKKEGNDYRPELDALKIDGVEKIAGKFKIKFRVDDTGKITDVAVPLPEVVQKL